MSPRRHIIVSGDDVLATTIAEELNRAGATIVKLPSEELAGADLARASAIVCAGRDDAKNLEIALLARKTNPHVRVVARLGNDVLRGRWPPTTAPAPSSTSPTSPPPRSSRPACRAAPTRSGRPASTSWCRGPRHPATRRFGRSTATWRRWR
ncbi:trkA-N domain protein [Mycobacterium avium subsp. avium 2285 (R)]|nr:trkA-N domain protein [Mycobacterium avium subsp. avium 2285 (R)]